MNAIKLAMASALALLLIVNAHAALVSTAGGLGVYDTVNNVTWTSDGNLFATQAASYAGGASAFVAAVIAASGGVIHDTPNAFDTVPNSGNYTLQETDFYTVGEQAGYTTWWGARAWVNYLNVTNYAGTNTWALPTTVNSGSSYAYPPSQSSSQLAQLFYGDLGQVAGRSITSTHNSSYALFTNFKSDAYWSGTELTANPGYAWVFVTDLGYQMYDAKTFIDYALAVSPGQVGELSAVPAPGAAWLLGSGLTALLGLRRRKGDQK